VVSSDQGDSAVPIVSLYASLLALVFVALSVRTLRLRRQLRIPVGDGGNPALLRAMRAHGNFAEYVPLSLLLIGLLEHSGVRPWWIHGLGLSLLVGRLVHAVGVSRVKERYMYRVVGMALTLVPLVTPALQLLGAYARHTRWVGL
jgi:uncharacterized protein